MKRKYRIGGLHGGPYVDGCLHFVKGRHRYYDSPLLAIAFNVGEYSCLDPYLVEVDCDCLEHDGTKGYTIEESFVREVDVPDIPALALPRWAIMVTLEAIPLVIHSPDTWEGIGAWQQWAQRWLDGDDRLTAEAYEPYMREEEVPAEPGLTTSAAYHTCITANLYEAKKLAARAVEYDAHYARLESGFDGTSHALHLDKLLRYAIFAEWRLRRRNDTGQEVTV